MISLCNLCLHKKWCYARNDHTYKCGWYNQEKKTLEREIITMGELTDILKNAIKEIQICLNTKGGRACGKSYAYGKLDAYKEVLKIIEELKEQSDD